MKVLAYVMAGAVIVDQAVFWTLWSGLGWHMDPGVSVLIGLVCGSIGGLLGGRIAHGQKRRLAS